MKIGRWGFALGVAVALVSVFSARAQSPELMDAYEQYQSLRRQGDYTAAVAFAMKVLRLGESEFGPHHKNTAIYLDNLAQLYVAQDLDDEAEPIFKRLLSVLEKTLGPEHPDVAASLTDLAWLYFRQERYAEAEPLFKRSLRIRERVLGPEHLHVADILEALVEMYDAQGRDSEAEFFLKRAIGIRNKARGPKNPVGITEYSVLPDSSEFNGQTDSLESSNRYKMLEFPWPPPRPSSRMSLPREPFLNAFDLDRVSSILISALRTAGYWEYSFHGAGNGFALVTRFERMNEDGSQVTKNLRYQLPHREEPFSLSSYIQKLFFAAQGYYRLIVFVVTDRTYSATGKSIDELKALSLLSEGANVLPPEYARKEFSKGHSVDVLIYEFQKNRRDKQAELLWPGRLSPQVHFDKIRMSAAFDLHRN